MDAVVERYECLGACDTVNHLDFVVEQIHQMLVVAGVELDEHRVGACGEVALNHFGDFLKLRHHIAVHGSALEVDADVGAGAVTEYLRVDVIARSGDDVKVNHALNALVDSGARDATFSGDIFRGDACVACYY